MKVKQLHAARNAEIMELRHKERENEQKLVSDNGPDKSNATDEAK
jgi:hypothetical protein